jgi:hypothetical protein
MEAPKPLRGDGSIIYNVTTSVTTDMAEDWMEWLINEHAPELIGTGCFTKFHLLKLLQLDDSEGPIFAVQYHAENITAYERYLKEHAAAMQQKAIDRWGAHAVSFRTLMEIMW